MNSGILVVCIVPVVDDLFTKNAACFLVGYHRPTFPTVEFRQTGQVLGRTNPNSGRMALWRSCSPDDPDGPRGGEVGVSFAEILVED